MTTPKLTQATAMISLTHYFCPTLKEVPREAEVISQQLMLRAGLIQKVSAGIYNFLPMGLRVIRKFEAIVREEMNRVSGQEVLMPMVIPASLWETSGRWDKYGKELLRLKDRQDNEFCLGPTHEEVVTMMANAGLSSYKQLPVTLYQIQTKFRDEIRPRFGVMRGREFGMKDAYSFHEDKECLDRTYQQMSQAYERIFQRCGLDYVIVDADSGAIGGSASAEFMIKAETGEDTLISCPNCGYAANMEAAETLAVPMGVQEEGPQEKVATPTQRTIDEVAALLSVSKDQLLKTLIYHQGDVKQSICVLIRGDHQLNELKLKNHLGWDQLQMATDEQVLALTGTQPGFVGPVNMAQNLPVIADLSVQVGAYYITGANEVGFHLKGVQIGETVSLHQHIDIRNAQVQDTCARCQGGQYEISRGIEVGHIFKLGQVYSESMKAQFLNTNGKATHFEMGCYGVGIGRSIAASIEQLADEKGIRWPKSLAPFDVDIIIANMKSSECVNYAEKLYAELTQSGVETIIDDRSISIGVKFKDADLIGFSVQVIIGKTYEKDHCVDITYRLNNTSVSVQPEAVLRTITDYLGCD